MHSPTPAAAPNPGKHDLKRELRSCYDCPADRVTEVVVRGARFLAIDGAGDPNVSPDYAAAVEALFGVAYAIKFAVKRGPLAIDYGVMPLEGLWWADDMAAFSVERKGDWKWTMMIRQPEWVNAELVATVLAGIARRKETPRRAGELELREFDEGRCLQILHVGPFSEEGPAIARLHAEIAARGAKLAGKHHEIYLSDVRRAAPAKWRTILRQPFV
jgi:hypothetical protein